MLCSLWYLVNVKNFSQVINMASKRLSKIKQKLWEEKF